LEGYHPTTENLQFTPTDRWLLARLANLLQRVTTLFNAYEYATAKSEAESFFWHDLADNYLEMCKERLYGENNPFQEGARYTLYHALLSTVKIFAPLMPYVTEEIYRGLFAENEGQVSIHLTRWPEAEADWASAEAEAAGDILIEVATAVRRYKSAASVSLGAKLGRLLISTQDKEVAAMLNAARLDILGVTRAKELSIGTDLTLDDTNKIGYKEGVMTIGLEK
jgi:valyl-tRNA synthetase